MNKGAALRPRPDERLQLLDGLRTIAALGVLCYHLPRLFGIPLFGRAYLFVDLFFLLSGFVLTLSAEPRMQDGFGARKFLAARVRRLWPLMALGSVLGAAVFATQVPAGEILRLLVIGLLFIPLLSGSPTLFPLNAPQWSLLWELAANVLHALLLRRLSDGQLLAVAAGSGGALAFAVTHAGCNCAGPDVELWWLAAPRTAWSYTLGAFMARKWAARRPAPLVEWRVALTLPAAILLALPWIGLGRIEGDLLAVIVLLPVSCWIAASAVAPARHHMALARLGSLSFPLYAVHLPVVLGFKYWSATWFSSLLAFVATVLSAVAIALVSARLRKCKTAQIHRETAAEVRFDTAPVQQRKGTYSPSSS